MLEESTRLPPPSPYAACGAHTFSQRPSFFLFPEGRPSLEDGLGEMVSLLESSRPGAGLRPELITK